MCGRMCGAVEAARLSLVHPARGNAEGQSEDTMYSFPSPQLIGTPSSVCSTYLVVSCHSYAVPSLSFGGAAGCKGSVQSRVLSWPSTDVAVAPPSIVRGTGCCTWIRRLMALRWFLPQLMRLFDFGTCSGRPHTPSGRAKTRRWIRTCQARCR